MNDMQTAASKTMGTLLIGAAIGYGVSLLMSPDMRDEQSKMLKDRASELKKLLTDADEQERVREIFKENTAEARRTYHTAKQSLITLLTEMKGALEDIDKQKYLYAVDEAISEVKEDRELPKAQLERLKQYLSDDFQKLKNNVALS